MCEQRRSDLNFPPLLLNFYDAADDQVANLGGVARAEGNAGEELVGFQDCAEDGRVD